MLGRNIININRLVNLIYVTPCNWEALTCAQTALDLCNKLEPMVIEARDAAEARARTALERHLWGNVSGTFKDMARLKTRKGIGEPGRPGSPKGSSKGSPSTRERIITLIAANPRITSNAIASSLGITKRAVLKQIRRLKDEGLLLRIGSPRAGYWEVKDRHA